MKDTNFNNVESKLFERETKIKNERKTKRDWESERGKN